MIPKEEDFLRCRLENAARFCQDYDLTAEPAIFNAETRDALEQKLYPTYQWGDISRLIECLFVHLQGSMTLQ